MDYMLRYPLNPDDINFLNTTSIQYEIIDTRGYAALTEFNPDASMHDSGWCDMATNARIISDQDRAVFRYVNETDALMLLLKFGDRLKELTTNVKEIYNIAQQHNTDPVKVFDAPQF